ncbi:MAG: ribonuclease E/G [Eubacteriales bacterium]|nr:ribonuclease E/G [Eubacteriales bacterium]
MSKLIISRMEIEGILCDYTALIDHNRLLEFHFQPVSQKSILDNIYVGQVDNLVKNIQGAFIKINKDTPCYYDLKEQNTAIYTSPKKSAQMVPGDQVLVQVCRDAIKSKQPAVTTNLSFKGKYLVLTTGKKGIGLSGKLDVEEKKRLKGWLEEADAVTYGLVVRTNARDASKEELLKELELLKKRCERILQFGVSRTCFSLLEEREAFYLSVLRNTYTRDLEEIVTDIPQLYQQIMSYLTENQPEDLGRLRFYEDALLPLIKLYGIEKKFDEVRQEKVWLKSGGFLVIQPTEALVSIDVNTGKFIGKKKAEETYRKINLEAAEEIARQLRVRNLSGIILIDFINMSNPDHNEELLHVLQKYLRKDPVKAIVHDMTQLNLVEVTRKKVEKPLSEELTALRQYSVN